MTDRVKISELPELVTVAPTDQIVVLDVSDTTESPEGTTKRAAKSELKGLNWQGAWSAGSYLTDDAVEHNGSAYVANADTSEEPSGSATDWDLLASKGDQGDQGIQGIQGDQGIQGIQGDKGLQYQGAWSAGTYQIDDAVENGGSLWIALQITTEEPVAVSANWGLLASKGDTGATGDTGAQGIQGEKGNQWQGAWSAGTYQIDDVVEHNGSSWIAIAITTQEPSNVASEWDLFAARGEDGEGSGDMMAATYDPSNKQVDAFDMDHMDEGADTKIMTAAERTKLGNISVTQAVDLDQMETDIAALANGMVYKGDWDASAGTFPGAGVAQTGWFYYVTVAGTVDGVAFAIGDNIVAVTDNASATVYTANWSKHDQTDAVQAVVGLTGSISKVSLLSALNVEDGADVTDAVNVGSVNNAATGKTTPVDADTFPITDTEASNVIKKVTFTNFKAFLKTYFDTLYQAVGGGGEVKTYSSVNAISVNDPVYYDSATSSLKRSDASVVGTTKFIGFAQTATTGIAPSLLDTTLSTGTSFSVDVPAGNDRVAVVFVSQDINTSSSPSGNPTVTLGGVSMTQIATAEAKDGGSYVVNRTTAYILALGSNVSAGSQTLSISFSGNRVDEYTEVLIYDGVNQTTTYTDVSSQSITAAGSSSSTSNTPASANKVIIGAGTTSRIADTLTPQQDTAQNYAGSRYLRGATVSLDTSLITFTIGTGSGSFRSIVSVELGATTKSAENVDVQLTSIVSGLSSLAESSVYYVQNGGGIGLSAGSNSLVVGKAVSPTELLIIQQ